MYTTPGTLQPSTLRGIARESIGWSIALSIVLILVGLFAILAPLLAGVALTGILGWLLILVGAGHLWLAWHVRGAGAHIWEAVIGLAYIVAGIFLLFHPIVGLVGITAILGAYLLIRGIFELIAGLSMRGIGGNVWLLINGAISLILAFLIWRHLPYSADWFIGTLIGFALLFTGISRLAVALTARRLLTASA